MQKLSVHALFALSLGFAGLILATNAGWAQGERPCGARDQVLNTLTTRFGEERRGIGLAGQGAVVELHSSADTGSWTITVTLPSGATCLLTSGQGWETVVDKGLSLGDPA
ncbi:MAG: hypothetical protein Q7J57_03910 [Gemmobacter sp.]|nr:hypothetical protein [Gemmobacter sp.]